MSIKEAILISVSLVLLAMTIYFKVDATKLKEKNEQIEQEFLQYKQNEISFKREQEKTLAEQARKQKAQERQKFLQLQKEELKTRVNSAYILAQKLSQKYKNLKNKKEIIIEALTQRGVYIKNYQGDMVNDVALKYLDNSNRAIPLEEIQKVRRHKEGYINIATKNEKQIIYVKNLQIFDLFIGASVIFR